MRTTVRLSLSHSWIQSVEIGNIFLPASQRIGSFSRDTFSPSNTELVDRGKFTRKSASCRCAGVKPQTGEIVQDSLACLWTSAFRP
jgi:hypothetical protein